jgi:tripartite-type tricarboxylate transporter receptor subunit TctC
VRLDRRRILQLATGANAFLLGARTVLAQAYPLRPVHILVGFAPGGTGDIIARLIGQFLSERFGQQFVVENRPGGGGNIAAEAVTRSAPDGYTLLWVSTANAVNTTLYGTVNFDLIRDVAPVAGLIRSHLVMQSNPSLPAKTLPELIAYARAHPGKVSMASPGNGTSPHLAGELFKMMTGLDIVHVPYRGGGPALIDLMAGHVQILFTNLPTQEYVKAGKLRSLAVTSANRVAALPDVPAISEFVPGYEATAWYGLGATKNTPPAIIATLNREINASLVDPGFTARLAALDGIVIPGLPSDFGKLIAAETDKWAKVVKFANIKPE